MARGLLQLLCLFLVGYCCAKNEARNKKEQCADECFWIICPVQEKPKGLTEDVEIYLKHLKCAKRFTPQELEEKYNHKNFKEDSSKWPSVILHLEQVWSPSVPKGHSQRWLMFNPEIPQNIQLLASVDIIIAKTQHTVRLAEEFRKEYGFSYTILLLGHTSRDRLAKLPKGNLPEKNYQIFLHVAGDSLFKGSDVVLSAWLKNPSWPMLIFSNRGLLLQYYWNQYVDAGKPKNILWITDFITQEKLDELMNLAGTQLCPSIAEGYGHVINGARSVGSILVVPDATPMSELVNSSNGFLVPANIFRSSPVNTNYKVPVAKVDVADLEVVINKIIKLPDSEKILLSKASRQRFEEEREAFIQRTKKLNQLVCNNRRSIPSPDELLSSLQAPSSLSELEQSILT